MINELAKASAYIFDMDGTLVDSEPIGPATFVELFKKHGVSVTHDELSKFKQSWRRIGNYIHQDDLLQSLFDKYSVSQTNTHEFYELYNRNLLYAKPLSGVDDFLRQAHRDKKRLVVVSASKKHQINTVLNNNNWSDLFEFVVGEEDVSAHKPNPEGYNFAIKKLELSPNEVIIFEDSRNGVLAAKNSNAYTIGVHQGSFQDQDLSAANLAVGSFADLRIII